MARRHRRAASGWRPDDGPAVTAGTPIVPWGRLASYDAVSRAGWLFLLPAPGTCAPGAPPAGLAPHPSELPGVI
jgi:hypothetical protein